MGIESDIKKAIQLSLQDTEEELLDEFHENFRRKAFFSEKWKRKRKGGYRSDKPLLLDTGNLRTSIRSVIEDNKIVFTSELPYAKIHNEGGTITVTRRMKGYFWMQYKKSTEGLKKRELTSEAAFYKAMALKKVGSKIVIPRRQFIGNAPEVETAVREIIENNLSEYFNSDQFKINIK